MTDNQAVAQSAEETKTSQTNSPQVEEAATEPQTTVDAEKPATQAVPDEVPGDIEEQRRAFQEMRQELKRLKEEKEARSKGESAFDAFRPKASPLGTGQPDPNQFVDPTTGEFNQVAYNQAFAQSATRQAQITAQETTREMVDELTARQKYPELFDDPKTEKQIASLWFFEKYQGNNVSLTHIAEDFAKGYSKAVAKAEKLGAEKVLTEVTEKEQAALSAANQSQGAQTLAAREDDESLRTSARFGNDESLARLVSKVPWAGK